MKERPLLLTKGNRAKVRSGDKTQTRRVLSKKLLATMKIAAGLGEVSDFVGNGQLQPHDESYIIDFAPYQVGDHAWLLEPYQVEQYNDEALYLRGRYSDDDIIFKVNVDQETMDKWVKRKYPFRRTSSRFMYKRFARTWCEITSVKVEWVRDISLEDIRAEGLVFNYGCDGSIMRTEWKNLWDSINKKRGFGCDVNPWVFAYGLKRIEK